MCRQAFQMGRSSLAKVFGESFAREWPFLYTRDTYLLLRNLRPIGIRAFEIFYLFKNQIQLQSLSLGTANNNPYVTYVSIRHYIFFHDVIYTTTL